ncbi:MAG: hypothetical protein ACREBV_02935, partial [Candidatus Zixiibacteriota bacterium]
SGLECEELGMLYTSVEKVKQHLISIFPVHEMVLDQPVILTETENVTFFGGAVDEQTFLVKSIQSNDLKSVILTLGPVSTGLPDKLLIRGTVVVASDSSLGTIFIENKDFVIDYPDGRINIKSGGSLSSGQKAVIWYGFYFKYSVSSDFVLDASQGTVRRTANGDIASGETVYLDYSPIIESYHDVMIQNAVDEANLLIEKIIDPEQQFGLEPLLMIAATSRAVEIVSRASAARELSSQRGEHNVALGWLKLAEDYADRADKLILAFRAPFNGPSAPAVS